MTVEEARMHFQRGIDACPQYSNTQKTFLKKNVSRMTGPQLADLGKRVGRGVLVHIAVYQTLKAVSGVIDMADGQQDWEGLFGISDNLQEVGSAAVEGSGSILEYFIDFLQIFNV